MNQINFKQTELKLHGTNSRFIGLNCDGFTLTASRHGVSIKGELDLTRDVELDTLAEAIARVWKWHKKLKAEATENV